MKNINSNLAYILAFIGITVLSFGITFGALSAFAKDEPVELTEPEASVVDRDTKPQPGDESNDTDLSLETIKLSDTISIDTQIPAGWTIQQYLPDPASTDENDIPAVDIKSPEVLNDDGSGTGIHFCLTFANPLSITPNQQAVLDIPSASNSTEVILGTPSNLQIKTPPETPDQPLMLVTSNAPDRPQNSYLAMPDDTQVMITGQFKCRDNPDATMTNLSAEAFSELPEFKTARQILISAEPSLTDPEVNNPNPEASLPDTPTATVTPVVQ